ncbi:hypothetical protein [Cryptosporangium minutisporangium]|uniref:Uncharacterized protein n=1 Tax=Cryptosporangium minutisporangium TaxID=113569 RepID=A0ABP6SSH4_9ACTN
MRWLRLYLRSRRVPLALAVAVTTVALVGVLTARFSDARLIDVRPLSLTVVLAVSAFAATLGAADEALERTASVRWPLRRLGHLALVGALVVGLVLLLPVEAGVVVRNTAGLLGLTALGAAVFGAARSWIAPLIWTLVAATPFVQVGPGTGSQLVAWLVQPPGAGIATVCAGVLAVSGALAYALRGCPPRPTAEPGS